MKLFTPISTALALLISAQAFAAANFISCPSFETIRANDTFSNPWIEDQVHNRWMLQSTVYKHNLAKWRTYIAVPLPGVNNQGDAIKQGTDYFKNKVILATPKREVDSTSTVCYYTSVDQEYAALAITPPYGNDRIRI